MVTTARSRTGGSQETGTPLQSPTSMTRASIGPSSAATLHILRCRNINGMCGTAKTCTPIRDANITSNHLAHWALTPGSVFISNVPLCAGMCCVSLSQNLAHNHGSVGIYGMNSKKRAGLTLAVAVKCPCLIPFQGLN